MKSTVTSCIGPKKNFGAHPPTPAPVATKQTVPESEGKNDDKALQTTEPSRAPNRRIGGKRTAPKCVIRLVKSTEFIGFP